MGKDQIDAAIQSVVGGHGDLVQAVKNYVGEDPLGVYQKKLIESAEKDLPRNLQAHVAGRVRDLLRTNPNHPRLRFG